jgi:hypothetical protein
LFNSSLGIERNVRDRHRIRDRIARITIVYQVKALVKLATRREIIRLIEFNA